MYCHECGTEVRPEHKFCPNCGTSLARSTEPSGNGYAPKQEGAKLTEVKRQAEVLSRAVGGAVHGKVSQVFQVDKSDLGQTKSSTQLTGTVDNRVMLLIIDAAAMAAVTFCPWVGSYFGEAKSLPSLFLDGFSSMSRLGQYSEYAYEYGGGPMYEAIMGFMAIVAVVAAFGWVATMYYAWKDMSRDYRGEQSDGNGSITLAVTAAVTKVLVWLGVFVVKSKLENDYFDLSYIGESAIYTTGWVLASFAIGIAGVYLRKSKNGTTK